VSDRRRGRPAPPLAQGPYDLPSLAADPRSPVTKPHRVIAVAVSVGVHLLALAALMSARATPPKPVELEPITVELVEPRPLAKPVTPLEPPRPAPTPPPPPQRNIFRPTPKPPPPDVEPLAAGKGPTALGDDELSDAQLSAATTAGSGAPGRACNMPRLLQAALRRDPMVQAAVADVHSGKPIVVWNGDWVRHPGQEGAGLAAVREAIMWEIGFATEACRNEPVHGLVLLSLNDAPGSARLVVGSGVWRWTDLLFARSGRAGSGR